MTSTRDASQETVVDLIAESIEAQEFINAVMV